ncbi:Heat shock factor-binding protein, putative [Perkinsus marinus ATCC 50983]|uniref:Heat shock factor-binding protein, putative n=1 Tax=Perkinsus marinus (strain ATCC 50983 / TXsc) TaxID=423536 RepID=C5KW24_PERM5|nr:Heat shock factor-binding protein, putative [Perkinsus marinus ATCC 50983]EER11320.1 Heat shock factor-binding protein, putative [Perkinsus marinus ATCC 50983]|eukprot:XP_002779525.1 Heat shock factor-binding protein, putative [Perkinsus marinus ATCC 50983]
MAEVGKKISTTPYSTEPADAERSSTSPKDSSMPDQSNQELTSFVSNLLKEMQTRFQNMSDTIVGRIDDMTSRVDDLERSIQELANKTSSNDLSVDDK